MRLPLVLPLLIAGLAGAAEPKPSGPAPADIPDTGVDRITARRAEAAAAAYQRELAEADLVPDPETLRVVAEAENELAQAEGLIKGGKSSAAADAFIVAQTALHGLTDAQRASLGKRLRLAEDRLTAVGSAVITDPELKADAAAAALPERRDAEADPPTK